MKINMDTPLLAGLLAAGIVLAFLVAMVAWYMAGGRFKGLKKSGKKGKKKFASYFNEVTHVSASEHSDSDSDFTPSHPSGYVVHH